MKMLRTARKATGLTMKELGEKVGVSESAISQYETGKREADFETLLKIGEVLDCSIDYLLRGEQEKKTTPVTEDGLDDMERELIRLFRELNREGREQLVDTADTMVSSGKYKKSGATELGKAQGA